MLSDIEKHRTELVSSGNRRSEESSAWSWKNITGSRCPMVPRLLGLCTSSTGGLFGERKLKFHSHLPPSRGVPGSELFDTGGEICLNTAWLILHMKVQCMGLHNSEETLFYGCKNTVLCGQKKKKNRKSDGGKHDLKIKVL